MPRAPRSSVALVVALGLAVAGAPGTAAAPPVAAVDDPVYAQGLQWSLARIGVEQAWARATGEGVTIAVIDSGVDLDHQDLERQIVGSISCIGAAGDPSRCRGSAQDDNGHGTHVAGVAAAATDNGVGMASIAPRARILAVRVLANECTGGECTASGSASDVVAGIRYAVAHGADVINLSLGGGALQSVAGCAFCRAIEEAWAAGVISVVAAGNDAVLPAGFGDTPAVVVTATTRSDARASYSSSNSSILAEARWPVAAPGGEAESDPSNCRSGGRPDGILSTYWAAGTSDAYACLAGTSMAAPHVTGGLALLLSAGLTPGAAIDRLLATAADLGPPGRDASFGAGRIDLARAVGQLPPGSTTVTPAPSSTVGGASATTAPTSAPPTTAPPTTAPAITTPVTSPAAPFAPEAAAGPGRDPAEELPAWLVVTALAAVLAALVATGAVARHLHRPT